MTIFGCRSFLNEQDVLDLGKIRCQNPLGTDTSWIDLSEPTTTAWLGCLWPHLTCCCFQGACWWSQQGQWCLILLKQLWRYGLFPVAWNAKLQAEQANRYSQGRWSGNWKRSVFIPIPKKGNAKECSNYCIIALISHSSKVMLKIL